MGKMVAISLNGIVIREGVEGGRPNYHGAEQPDEWPWN